MALSLRSAFAFCILAVVLAAAVLFVARPALPWGQEPAYAGGHAAVRHGLSAEEIVQKVAEEQAGRVILMTSAGDVLIRLEPHAVDRHGLDAVEIWEAVKNGLCVPEIKKPCGELLTRYLVCRGLRGGLVGFMVAFWNIGEQMWVVGTAHFADPGRIERFLRISECTDVSPEDMLPALVWWPGDSGSVAPPACAGPEGCRSFRWDVDAIPVRELEEP